MSWTQWRLLAKPNEWFDDGFDYDGPCCYELGTGGPRGGSIQPHYVGETSNEERRMSQYGRDGSHLSEIIKWHLKQGWCIYYRSYAVRSKAEAVQMQKRMLDKFKYDWNDRLNRGD
jgi:GIY-YIG domain-containing protein